MKKIGLLIVGFGIIGAMASCSKCYKCSSPVQIKTSTGTTTSYQEDEICTASSKEVEEKEDNGYTCTAS